MADKPWKAFERRMASRLGGERAGPSGRIGPDLVGTDGLAVECKLLSRPSFASMLAAARQAEGGCKGGELPVAVVRRKGRGVPDGDSLVVVRLEAFLAWWGRDRGEPKVPRG